MRELHSLLRRQLRRNADRPDPDLDNETELLKAINEAYWEFDSDRKMLERSMELTSQELLESNLALGKINSELEARVSERAADLNAVNDQLRLELAKRRQIEDDLAASEAELRALFAAMQDVVLVIDREGVYREIAPTNPGLLVRPPAELLGRNLKDVFTAEKAEDFRGAMQQVLETKQNAQVEYELIVGGRTIWFQTTISPLNADNTLWVAHDITNRKQIEEALRIAEANYRTIFENATVGIYQSTLQGSFLSVNPVMARLFGYETPEGMLNHIISIENQFYADPLHRTEFQRLMMEQGEVRDFIGQYRHKDGRHIWVQENARAVKDANGSILHYEGFITDITERRRAEEALHESEQRFRQLFNVSPDAIVLLDPHDPRVSWSIVDCNETACSMNGYRREEMIGQSIDLLNISPASREERAVYLDQLRGEGAIQVEAFHRHKDGHIFPVEIATTLFTLGGRELVLGIDRDITARRQAEEEVRRAKDALETANFELEQSLEREKLLACADGLTGICNRRHFFELADREFHAAVRHQRPLTFLMFDMDDFKQVNDTLGHIAGDKLLVTVAQTVAAQVRTSDVVARYGGDEFIVLLPHASAEQTLPVAERIRSSIAALRVETAGEPFAVTLSIGIAEMRHDPLDENLERVIQRADDAMYKAKQSGRNRTVLFGQDEIGSIG